MNYCSECGKSVVLRVPAGDNRPRHVCDTCSTIHYVNPKMVVGTIPEWEGRILLCRRAIEPRYGKWTLPAGFMENEETTAEGALRETIEEAGANVEIGEIYTVYNVPHINQVHIMHRARLINLDFAPGEESLEVMMFAEHEIPWDELAFRTVAATIRHYFADRRQGMFPFHSGSILPGARSVSGSASS